MRSTFCDRFLLKYKQSSGTNLIRWARLNTFQQNAIAKNQSHDILHWMEIPHYPDFFSNYLFPCQCLKISVFFLPHIKVNCFCNILEPKPLKELNLWIILQFSAVQGNVKYISTAGGAQDRGEAVVVAKKVLRQTANIFQSKGSSSEILGNVNFPLYCHWKKRSKHGYLFTGKLEPGRGPVVTCRIKFGLWRKLYHKRICGSVVART